MRFVKSKIIQKKAEVKGNNILSNQKPNLLNTKYKFAEFILDFVKSKLSFVKSKLKNGYFQIAKKMISPNQKHVSLNPTYHNTFLLE